MTEERYNPPRPFRKLQTEAIQAVSWLRIVAMDRLRSKSGKDEAMAVLVSNLIEELCSYTMALHDRLVDLRFLGETEEPHTEATVRTVTCSRAKSDMTPCYKRDGGMAIAYMDQTDKRPICVGCEVSIGVLNEEKKRADRRVPPNRNTT